MDEDFIARRKKKLDIWLNAVAQIPGVKDSGVIDEFLSGSLLLSLALLISRS